jgi:hypothetical protein
MAADFKFIDIVTPQFLKDTFIAGVDLTLDDGSAYPDIMFEHSIASALRMIENELGIIVDDTVITGERHDAMSDSRRAWWPISTDHRPLKEVDDIAITYGNYQPTSIPLSWVNIASENTGAFHLIPSAETLGTFSFSNAIPLLIDPITNYSYYRQVPSYFRLKYKAGFNFIKKTITIPQGQTSITVDLGELLVDRPNFIFDVTQTGLADANAVHTVRGYGGPRSKEVEIRLATAPNNADCIIELKVHTVPEVLIRCVGLLAAILPLDVAGDLIIGAGIARFNIGVDNLRQEVDTTSSATNSGYGARILSYKNTLKAYVKALKADYQTPKFGVI